MVKTLTLTEDHLKLIKCIKFEGFDFGERFDTSSIKQAREYIENDEELLKRFSGLAISLDDIERKLGVLNDNANQHGWGVNQYNLFGGTFVMEDVARIIGRYDKFIEGTKEDPLGADFSDEDKAYMWELYSYVWENMEYIFDLILYTCTEGGLKVGTYSLDRSGAWTYKG